MMMRLKKLKVGGSIEFLSYMDAKKVYEALRVILG